MAWTTATYAGQWAYGANGVLKTALFELCRAVNERQDCIGLTKTTFLKANGTSGTDLALSDFTNMFTSGPTSEPFAQNCRAIMTAIKAMRPYFCSSSGIDTPYTLIELETAVGLGAFLDEPRKANDPLFFQQCQDALDLLIYARRTGIFAVPSGLADADRRIGTTSNTDREVVWDNLAGVSPSTVSRGAFQIFYEYQKLSGTYSFGYAENNFQSGEVNLSAYEGTITAVQYSGTFSCPSGYAAGGSMTAYIGSTSLTDTVAPGNVNTQTVTGDIGDWTMSASNSFVITCDLPATCPLDEVTAATGDAKVQFQPGNWILYFDIAAELTDQA